MAKRKKIHDLKPGDAWIDMEDEPEKFDLIVLDLARLLMERTLRQRGVNRFTLDQAKQAVLDMLDWGWAFIEAKLNADGGITYSLVPTAPGIFGAEIRH